MSERRAKSNRTAKVAALEALMNRLPESVERQTTSGWERVGLHRLQVGDVVRVRAGESFPGDGVIVKGQTLVEEAMLTGESRPCGRGPQDTVMAASHNLSATVEVPVVTVLFSTIPAPEVSVTLPEGVLLAV